MSSEARHRDDDPLLRIVAVRHAPTRLNAERRYQGSSDLPLSPEGRRRARRLGVRLAGEGIERVLVSPRARARETAALALPGIPVVAEAGLAERDYGGYEGLTWAEGAARFGEAFRRWSRAGGLTAPPGGEPFSLLRERVGRVLAGLPATGRVALVAHSGTVRALLAEILGISSGVSGRFRISACGITVVERRGGEDTVVCVNETVPDPEEG